MHMEGREQQKWRTVDIVQIINYVLRALNSRRTGELGPVVKIVFQRN